MLFYYLLCYIYYNEKSAVTFLFLPLYVIYPFIPAFNIFSLLWFWAIWLRCTLLWFSLCYFCLEFVEFIESVGWWGFSKYGKFWLQFLQLLFLSPLLSTWLIQIKYLIIWNSLIVPWCSVNFFFNSLSLSLYPASLSSSFWIESTASNSLIFFFCND